MPWHQLPKKILGETIGVQRERRDATLKQNIGHPKAYLYNGLLERVTADSAFRPKGPDLISAVALHLHRNRHETRESGSACKQMGNTVRRAVAPACSHCHSEI